MNLMYTLLTDGSSDKMLMPIIDWLIHQANPTLTIESVYADLSTLKKPPKVLSKKISSALESYPCDILFVHRDAEKKPYDVRRDEINKAWEDAGGQQLNTPKVIVVPVRMSEAWLLIDSQAIKAASGNPHNKAELNLPKVSKLENDPNPKKTLHNLIKKASGLKGKRLSKLNTHRAVHLVVNDITDFSPLRQLPAFQKLETDIKTTLANYQPL